MPTPRVSRLAVASAVLAVAACARRQPADAPATSQTPSDSATRTMTGNARDSLGADSAARRDTAATPPSTEATPGTTPPTTSAPPRIPDIPPGTPNTPGTPPGTPATPPTLPTTPPGTTPPGTPHAAL